MTARRRAAFALLPVLWAAAPAAAAAELTWSPEPSLAEVDGATALAFDTERSRLAVGDESGAVLLERGASPRRVLRRGPVNDLVFRGGVLLVASDRGLFLVDPQGRVEDVSPAPGAEARAVRRLAWAGGLVLAATGDGAYASADLRGWRRLDAGLPAGAVDSVALARSADGWDAFLLVRGELWRAAVVEAPGGPVAADAERETVGQGGALRGASEVVVGLPGVQVAALGHDLIAGRDAGGWRILRPSLPPGAELRRLVALGGRLWLATSRGLLESAELAGSWRRAAPPAGEADVFAVVEAEGVLLAATDRGVLRGTAASGPAGAVAAAATPPPGAPSASPSVGALRAAVLRYLDLRAGDVRSLRRDLARRGFLPEVDLDLAYGGDRLRHRAYDESFTSGAVRQLHDRDRTRIRDFAADLTLSWDLGNVVYDRDRVDVSKETRELIELRDDVLDEVNHLYFERERVLLDLAASASPADAARLRLRAEELAAGLDAWSGGWFSQHALP